MYVSGDILPEQLAALMQTALFTEGASAFGDELLERILRAGMQAADSTAACLFLADKTPVRTHIAAYFYDNAFSRCDMQSELPAAAAWVVQQQQPLRIHAPDTETAFMSTGLPGKQAEAVSFIAVPLCCKGVCIGVLEAVEKNGGGTFSEADISLLGLVGSFAAPVYRASQAYSTYMDSCKYLQGGLLHFSDQAAFVAASAVMREKLEICKHLASSVVPVLLIGEDGVGKTSVAEQLHIHSSRAAHPFIRVNCAELTDDVLDCNLFGQPDSARTEDIGGAVKKAEGGTLFFDEVTALPLTFQNRLLHELPQREAVGKSVRLIASTRFDIEQAVRDGTFLSELYGQLNVLPLYIPPLRQRKEDILPLAQLFLRQSAVILGKPFTGFTQDVQDMLQNAEWKGNVQELKNTVEFGCIQGAPPLVGKQDLFSRSDNPFCTDTIRDMKTATEKFKRMYILAALKKSGGNQTAAAAALNIQRTYLSRLMKELKIRT